MNKWLMYVVALLLGMLMFHMLKNVCGCNNVVEGQRTNYITKCCDEHCKGLHGPKGTEDSSEKLERDCYNACSGVGYGRPAKCWSDCRKGSKYPPCLNMKNYTDKCCAGRCNIIHPDENSSENKDCKNVCYSTIMDTGALGACWPNCTSKSLIPGVDRVAMNYPFSPCMTGDPVADYQDNFANGSAPTAIKDSSEFDSSGMGWDTGT